jgi:hypothetical protein
LELIKLPTGHVAQPLKPPSLKAYSPSNDDHDNNSDDDDDNNSDDNNSDDSG